MSVSVTSSEGAPSQEFSVLFTRLPPDGESSPVSFLSCLKLHHLLINTLPRVHKEEKRVFIKLHYACPPTPFLEYNVHLCMFSTESMLSKHLYKKYVGLRTL